MRITFLAANVPLSKSFSLGPDGQLRKSSYPSVWEFSSITEDFTDLATFTAALERHAREGHCLLKGNVTRALDNDSRAGSTDANEVTYWVCLDIDRSTAPNIDAFLASIGLAGIDYVVQYSASYGIEPGRGLTAHVFMRLAAPALPTQLKQWLMHINLERLHAGLELTKTNTALSWPLDVTTCQNDKLLYISPPACEGFEPPPIKRIEHAVRGTPYLTLPTELPSADQLRAQMEQHINRLREAKGLLKRAFKYRDDGTLVKCDAATMSGIKQERGFTYFNLNGGDSWGYWHSDEHPEIIRNFKGEPDYLTKELLPEYWAQLTRDKDKAQAAAKEDLVRPTTEGDLPRVLVFRDFKTGIYYNGMWDPTRELLKIAVAKSELQVQHYLKERGLPEVDFIPCWDYVFDPHSDVRVDFPRRRVNIWSPSPFMKQPQAVEPFSFPAIERLIRHAFGRDELTYDHFINWLACVFQYRVQLGTAWIAHGIQGTGKGVFVNFVLAPLFGRDYVVIKRMEELEDQFNEYLERALFVVVDEAQISESRKSRMLMANLKNQITEPTITVRKMRAAAYSVRNYLNWLFLSNMPDPVMIDATDRRFNVGEYRTEKIALTQDDFDAIGNELAAFAGFLNAYPADLDRARTVLQSAERDRVIATSQTSTELVAEALVKGQLELFWESIPSSDIDVLPVGQQLLAQGYINLVHEALNGKTRFTRDELRVLFEFLCGDMPRTPTKFTQLLRHRNLQLTVMKINGRATRGLEVRWTIDPDWVAARKAELSFNPMKEKAA
jgi:hypothetical protein